MAASLCGPSRGRRSWTELRAVTTLRKMRRADKLTSYPDDFIYLREVSGQQDQGKIVAMVSETLLSDDELLMRSQDEGGDGDSVWLVRQPIPAE